ncbi:hypothetical protein, partial [Mesorhizobium sp. M4B.F.Ca.ET.089.01.1.1]
IYGAIVIFGRYAVLTAALFGPAGCIVGETFDVVYLHRDTDGKDASCSSGTYGVSMSGRSKNPPLNVTRCVAACEKAGFVVVGSFPRPDLSIETKGIGNIPESECMISHKS